MPLPGTRDCPRMRNPTGCTNATLGRCKNSQKVPNQSTPAEPHHRVQRPLKSPRPLACLREKGKHIAQGAKTGRLRGQWRD